MQKLINVPLFSQRDPAWKSIKLGTGTGSIGDYGCLLTACAMLAKYYGKDTDPKRLNELFIKNGSYASGNLYKWYEGISKAYPDIKVSKLVETPNPVTTAQFNEWKEEINNGRPVILQVDFYPSTAQPDMHFVLLVGYDDTNYYVADPYYGDVSNLTRYGTPKTTVLKYVFHTGTVPATPPAVDPEVLKLDEDIPSFVEDKYDLKSKEWYNKYWTLGDFIKETISAQIGWDKTKDELEKAQKENTNNETIIKNQIEEIKTKTAQIETLQKQAAENTAQLIEAGKSVKAANTRADEAEGKYETLFKEHETLKGKYDDAVKLNTTLKEKLAANLKGYSRWELFKAWLLGA